MPEDIVYSLELVEIDEKECSGTRLSFLQNRRFKPRRKQKPICEAGEMVMLGMMANGGLGLPEIADVSDATNQEMLAVGETNNGTCG